MLKPEKIEAVKLPHFSPNDEYLGDFTDLENVAFRVQICKTNVDGYYFMDGETKVSIDSNGKCSGWPYSWDQYMKTIAELFREQKRKREEK